MGKAEKPKSFLRECIEKIVNSWRDRRKTIRRRWQGPFIFVEWLCEGVSNLLKRWAFLDVLGHAGRFAILVAIIFYFVEADDRERQARDQQIAKHYQAWQVINAAQGQRTSGGRVSALQELNEDGVSLRGLGVSGAYLPGLRLPGAGLSEANLAAADIPGAILTGAYLFEADLTEVNLSRSILTSADFHSADLTKADLYESNLIGASLYEANLTEAVLFKADLAGAVLSRATLSKSSLIGANLTSTNLSEANLTEAVLFNANLAGADLKGVRNWRDIMSIQDANIYGVINAPEGFVEWAIEQGAVSIESEEEWEKFLSEKNKLETDNNRKNTKKVM